MGIDPVGFQEDNIHSFNRYAYANDNPYRFVDPDGRLPILVPILITAGLEALNLGFEAHDNINNLCGDCVRSSSFGVLGPVAGKGVITTGKILATKSPGAFSKVVPATAKQLQKKFKHAGDFGVSGNYSRANAHMMC